MLDLLPRLLYLFFFFPFVLPGNLSRPNSQDPLNDVCFHSPNSQEAVQILSVSSEARSRAGLALQRLHHSALFLLEAMKAERHYAECRLRSARVL